MNRSLTSTSLHGHTSLRGHTAVASGFLHKLTHNGTPLARWHQRYYVLYTDGLLCSYKSSRARNSHRVIHVGRKCLRVRFGLETRRDECSRWPKNSVRSQCFSVINSDREYHFYCDSEREFANWRDNLRRILTKLGSAHSSVVERRNSKLTNGTAGWLESGRGDDSSNEPTPASLRKLRPWVDKAQERKTTQKVAENNQSEREDAVVIPYTNLDDDDECEEETTKVDEAKTRANGLKRRELKRKEIDERGGLKEEEVNATSDADDEMLEPVSENEQYWAVSSYHNIMDTDDRVDSVPGQKSTVPGVKTVYSMKGIDAAFLEVQNILDQTFNDMC